jgi:hypothetical protein
MNSRNMFKCDTWLRVYLYDVEDSYRFIMFIEMYETWYNSYLVMSCLSNVSSPYSYIITWIYS